MTEPVWTTQDGRKIPVKWMDSAHLVNSFNMLCRKNSLSRNQVNLMMQQAGNEVFKAMVNELRGRMLYNWRPDGQLDTSKVPRETPAQLCMLRALLDCHYGPNEILLFRDHPDSSIQHWTSTADPKWDRLKPKFVEHRLNHGG